MLGHLLKCQPSPNEIIVHVDAGDDQTAKQIEKKFPDVELIQSETTMGPGGGRNRLVDTVKNEWVASFDDDSWPIEANFFLNAQQVINESESDLIACEIHERDQPEAKSEDQTLSPVSWFVGCGCLIRKSAFQDAGGFLPLRYAYGMEESDLAIKLIDRGSSLVYAPTLKVFHDCDRDSHHANPKINAAQISNIGLLCYLRYPLRCWPLGLAQVGNRVLFCIRKGRFKGILSGLLNIPIACWNNRSVRQPVSYNAFCISRSLRDC